MRREGFRPRRGAAAPGLPLRRRPGIAVEQAVRRMVTRLRTWRRRQIALLVVAGMVWATLVPVTTAVFNSTTASTGNALTALSLDPFVPATVSASRSGPTTCTVTWTDSSTPGPPANLVYDITDGAGTTLSGSVSGGSATVTIGATAVTPAVKARVGAWLSGAARTSATPCAAVPDAPTNVALTAGSGLLVVTWTAPSGNGSAVTGYTVTATPAGGGAAVTCVPSPATSTSCTVTGLTNGTTYSVTVSATNANGTGAASAAVSGTPIAGRALDGVSASSAAAYSVRRLRSGYTGIAMTVRRASDSTTSGIGFIGSGDLDTATLLSFCASTSCYVTTWNDQSGNAHDLVQASTAAQPRIVSSGVLDAVGGRPTLVFSGAQQLRTATDAVSLGGTAATGNAVASGSGASAGRFVSFTGTGQTDDNAAASSAELLRLNGTTAVVTRRNGTSASASVTTTTLGAYTAVHDGTNETVYVGTTTGGSAASSGTFGATGTVNVGANRLADSTSLLTGAVGEVTLFPSALGSTDRSVLSGSQSAYFLLPAAPTDVTATAADTTSTVTWTAPTLTGATALTTYTVTAVPSDGTLTTRTCTANAPVTTCNLSGLTNGVTYTVTVTAANSGGTGPASASVTVIPYPATLMSGAALSLWLDGADASTLLTSSGCSGATATSSVGCWKDKSASANNAAQPSAGNQPSLSTVAGRSVPTFDGSAQQLVLTPSLLPTGSTPSAAFLVARLTDPTPASSGWRLALSWGAAGSGLSRADGKAGLSAAAAAVSSGGSASSAGSWPSNGPALLDDEFSSTSYRSSFNGIAATAVTGSFSTSTSQAYVGSNVGPADFWQGPVAEAVVLSGTITTSQRRTVQEYLARKWGLTIAPGIPTGLAATPSDTTATLSWTAPSWNGGSSVTGYTATAVPVDSTLSTVTCTSASTGCTLTGLTTGAAYTVSVTATNAVGTGSASTAVTVVPYPASVMTSSATKLWLDGADPATLLVGGCSGSAASTTVDCWKDKSGSTTNVAAPTSGQRPVLSSTTSAGGTRQVPLFDGTDDVLSAASSTLPTGTTASTAFVVAESTDATPTTSGERVALAWGTSSTGALRGILKPTTANSVAVNAYQTTNAVSSTWPSGTPLLAASQFSAGTYDVRTNGRPAATVTYAYNTSGTALSASSAGSPWKGRVDEIVVLNTTLTSTQRRAVEEYLARKWGVTITPGIPGALTGSAGDSQVTLSWTAPAWNGGSAITGYTVTASPGGATCTSTSTTTCTVTGLTNGTGYTFTVTATNAIGTGPASASTTTITPPGPAGTPTGVQLTPGDAQIGVAWTAPATGSPYTLYTATGTPSDNTLPTRTCSATPPAVTCTLTSLTNGVGYSVTVVAQNAAGTGTATTAITGIPYPASIMTSSATKLWLDAATATLWSDNACSTPVTAAGQDVACWTDRSTNANNLKNTTASQIPKATSTGVGTGLAPNFDGTDDQLATNTNNGMPVGSSDSTTFVVAKITASPPSSLGTRNLFRWGNLSTTGGGRAQYLVSGAGGTQAVSTTMVSDGTYTANVAQISASVFSGGTSYALRFAGRPTVSNAYSYSTGFTSITLGSASVPPQGPILEVITLDSALSAANLRTVEEYLARKWGAPITPSAPTAVTGNSGNASATVSWVTPAWNGGASIASYTVTASPGGATCTATAPTTQCTVTGLTNGTAYTFTVTATNSVGVGPASAATSSVTPATVPSAPTGVTANVSDSQAVVSWTAAAANGSAVTDYLVTATPSDGTLPTRTCIPSPATALTCTVTALTNGGSYAVTVRATNAVGTGANSTAVTAIPYPSTVMAAPDLELWLDGADTSTLFQNSGCSTSVTAAGQYLRCWKDKSGNSNNATQSSSTSSTWPTTASVGGRILPSFNGSSTYLDVSPSALPTGSTAGTIVTAGIMTDSTPTSSSYRTVVNYGTISSKQARGVFKDASSAGVFATTWTANTVTSGTWNSSAAQIAIAEFSSPLVTLWTSGTSGVSSASGSYTTGTTVGYIGMASTSNGYYWLGQIPEVMVFTGSLTTAERRQVEEYLARKWGSSIPPSAPQSPSATVASTTSVAVSWSAPAWNGGASVSTYTVTSSPGSKTCSTSGTSCTVTGLTTGTTYTFTVTATNSVGTGAASAASNSAKP